MRVTHSSKSSQRLPSPWFDKMLIFTLIMSLMIGFSMSSSSFAQQAQWIWNAKQINGNVPLGPVHFRKTFRLAKPTVAEVVIAADDEFQVYFNG